MLSNGDNWGGEPRWRHWNFLLWYLAHLSVSVHPSSRFLSPYSLLQEQCKCGKVTGVGSTRNQPLHLDSNCPCRICLMKLFLNSWGLWSLATFRKDLAVNFGQLPLSTVASPPSIPSHMAGVVHMFLEQLAYSWWKTGWTKWTMSSDTEDFCFDYWSWLLITGADREEASIVVTPLIVTSPPLTEVIPENLMD